MNTLRNDVNVDFTIIPNILISCDKLSWKAKGIFTYLASKPDDWQFYMADLVKRATDGKSACQTGVAELEDHGFLIRRQTRAADGTLSDFQWIICVPDDLKQVDDRLSVDGEIRQTDKPSDGKAVRRKTASHSNTENSNTELSNTELSKTERADDEIRDDHPLQIGIRQNCPNISKIRDQLTYEQAEKLLADFDNDLIIEKIEGLENKKSAPKDYTSVYLTIRNWCRMELKRQPSNRRHNDKRKAISTAQQAFELGID